MQKIMHTELEGSLPWKVFLWILSEASKIRWTIVMGTGEKMSHLRSHMGLDSSSGLTLDVHPSIIVQPFHQHQVQHVWPKHPFVQHFLWAFLKPWTSWQKILGIRIKEGCRPFEHNMGRTHIQNILVLDIDYLAEVQGKGMKRCRTGGNPTIGPS